MYQVRPALFFGDFFDAANHDAYREYDIDVVVKLTGTRPEKAYPDAVEVNDFAMPDGETNAPEEFAAVVTRVQELLQDGETVFVHCAAGQSRSVCVAAATHALLDDEPFEYGLNRLQELRDVNPHPTVAENARLLVDGEPKR
jgi:predicted protein tyrosine phosphatase